jgi:Uma2 family endonuclease
MAQALLQKDDGFPRLAITVDMLEAMVAAGTIDDPTRVELIEGELVTMSPTHLPHARLTAKLLRLFGNSLSDAFEVFDGVSLRLNDYNEPVPDICVAYAGILADVLASEDCALVIEVAEATARKDRLVKAPLYAKAGIVELWIVDLNTQETLVHRGPGAQGWATIDKTPFTAPLVPLFDDSLSVVISTL